jgi:hypothetical protein
MVVKVVVTQALILAVGFFIMQSHFSWFDLLNCKLNLQEDMIG